ncbi:MAG: hypothetical protein HN509_12465 [Halobacteriovoraceae bacterium]|jgi:CysZ protein|nr:hypothetical protein [Halobacteriovoraceae bacterium]
MGLMIKSFGEALGVFRKDKIIILFSAVPVFVGIALYYFLGDWIFTDVRAWGQGWIEGNLSAGTLGTVLTWVLTAILSIIMYFVVNFTFVLVVSIFACPFNDLISTRVEKIMGGEEPEALSITLKKVMGRALFTLINELKKVSFILILTAVAFGLSFFPILAPVSVIISAFLLAVSFLDYSWSRHTFKFSNCLGDVKNNFFTYGFSGAIFLSLITIPFVNLLALPYGVIYFTVLFSRSNGQRTLS